MRDFHAALILNTSEVDHHLLSCTVPHQGDRKESCILVKSTHIPRNCTGDGTGGLRGFFCGRGTPRGLGLLSVAIVPVPVIQGVGLLSHSFSKRENLRVSVQDGV